MISRPLNPNQEVSEIPKWMELLLNICAVIIPVAITVALVCGSFWWLVHIIDKSRPR